MLRGRPALGFALGLTSGIACFSWPHAGLFALALWFLSPGIKGRIALLLGFGFGLLQLFRVLMPIHLTPGDFSGNVEVVGMPIVGKKSDRVAVYTGKHRLTLFFPHGNLLARGDTVFVMGQTGPVPDKLRAYALGHGIQGSLFTKHPPKIIHQGYGSWRLGILMRDSFVNFVSRCLSPRCASVVNALCFNYEADLEPGLWEALQRSGTIHIISTSGLHVAILAGALAWLCRLLPFPRWVQLALALLLLMVYIAAAGFQAPAFRSVMMAAFVWSAFFFEREVDMLSLMAVAGIIQIIWFPNCIFQLGFQLSYLTTWALIAYARDPLQWFEGFRPLTWLGSATKGSWVAWLGSLLPVAYYFGRISLTSVPANLLIFPVVSMVTVGSLICWLLFLFFPWLGEQAMRFVVDPCVSYLLGVIELLGGHSWTALNVSTFSGWWLPWAGLIVLWFWKPRLRTP